MTEERETHCYPECGARLALRLAAPAPTCPREPGHYEVALWRSWPARELPYLASRVPASSGFQAIERVMRRRGIRVVAHATAHPTGGQRFQAVRTFGLELPKITHTKREVSS